MSEFSTPLSANGSAPDSSQSAAAPGKDVPAITRALRTGLERGDAAAIAAVVVTPDGELYRGAVGEASVADHTPLTSDAIFRIFSMTKPVTSVAAMMLIEEKKLSLDDPISKFLSGKDAMQAVITMDTLGHFVSTPPATPITIRHLLTHTSGMAYSFFSEVVKRVQDSAPSIPDTSLLIQEPGERWAYGPSTKVLGDLVALASGQSLEAFFQTRIFTPLRMSDTAFTVSDANRPRLVTTFQRNDGKLIEQPTPAVVPVGIRGDSGLYSTAADYGRFMRMILKGGELDGSRVLSAATVQQMSTHQIGALTIVRGDVTNPAANPFPPGAGRDGFGFGFQIARPEKTDPQRRAAGALSWSGAMNTYFWIDPARRIGAALLTQVVPFADPAVMRLLDDFEGAVYSAAK